MSSTFMHGSVSFPIGSAGVSVRFTVPMPAANYSVVVQPTNTAGYSTTSSATYFNVLHKTVNGFDVQHKQCSDGTPLALDVGVTLDWIAMLVQ